MAWLDFLTNMPEKQQAGLAGLSQGLMSFGAGISAADQYRPWNQPAPSYADAFNAFGQGQRAGMLGAYAQQKAAKERKTAGWLSEASDPSRPEPLGPNDMGPAAPNTISPQAAAIRAAIPAGMLSVAGMMEPSQIAGLVAQRETQRQRPMTAEELQAAGFRPGSVVMVNDFTGAPNVAQQPDTLSTEAEEQRVRIGNRTRAPQQPQAPIAIVGPDGQPRLVPPSQAYGQRPYLPAENRQPSPGSDAEANVNIQRLAPSVGQGTASPEQVRAYLGALALAQQPRFDAQTGQWREARLPEFAPSAQDVERLYPGSIYRGAPTGQPAPYDPTQFGPRAGMVPPNAPGSPPVPPGAVAAPPAAPVQQAAPAAIPAQPAALPPGTVQGPAPGMVATPPPSALPGRGGESRAVAQPPQVVSSMTENAAAIRKVDAALAALEARPDGVGIYPGMLPGAVSSRVDPRGVELRALIADIGSLKIHDRSGAAVSAQEFPRLQPFIPSASDTPETVRIKLQNFRKEYAEILRDTYSYYGPANNYRQMPAVEEVLRGGAPSAPSAANRNPMNLVLPGAR